MSYQKDQPRVLLMNLETGQREVVGDFPGMTFAPRFSPDGQRIVMSLQREGDASIFEMDLRTRQSRQLTNSGALDTSPSYSPDGREIVFESDRDGTQQLFVMDSNGGNVRRISAGEGRYSTPVWSPRGDYIAFTKQLAGRFLIGVMRPDGSGERVLTEGFPQRRADLGAERARSHVFPRKSGRYGGAANLLRRSDRLQRTGGEHACFRVGSRVVAAAQISGDLNAPLSVD